MESVLAQYLREARLKKGISQAELSRQLGYSTPQFVCNWEKGRSSPPLEAVAKLLDILSVPQDEIVEVMLEETRHRIEERLLEFRKKKTKTKRR